jgi:hypothetical protein
MDNQGALKFFFDEGEKIMKKMVLWLVLCATLLLAGTVITYAADVHFIEAQKPYYLTDGLSGTTYTPAKGDCAIGWNDKTNYGFNVARFDITDTVTSLNYEFILVAVSNSDSNQIEGLWDIKRDGIIVAKGIVGKLYGLNLPIGSYIKFYGGSSQCNTNIWHFSVFITGRYDF